MKVVIVLAFLVIVGALGYAGLSMLRGGRRDGRAKPGTMMRALALRVAVSVALFLLLLAAWQLGWIRPTGIPTGG